MKVTGCVLRNLSKGDNMNPKIMNFLKDYVTEYAQDVHTAIPGIIKSFDPALCEASIKPFGQYKKHSADTPNKEKVDYPVVHQIPVMFLQSMAQTATIVWPVKPGDECLLIFGEQPLDMWQNKAETETDLRHDLSNAIAIVGLFADPNPLVQRSYDNESIIIQRENSFAEFFDKKIEIETDGDIFITAVDNIYVEAGQNIEIEAGQKITVNAGQNITVKAGQSIEIEAGESITVEAGENITIEAAENIKVKCKKISIEAEESITMKAPTMQIESTISHDGSMSTSGTHTDSVGPHCSC